MSEENFDLHSRSVSYSAATAFELGESGVIAIELKDVRFHRQPWDEPGYKNESISIEQPVFIFSTNFSTYFHTVRDNILHYELIRKHMPEVLPFAVSDIPALNDKGKKLDSLWEHTPGSVMEYISNTYFPLGANLLDIKNYTQIHFAKVVHLYTEFTGADHPSLPRFRFKNDDLELNDKLVSAVYEAEFSALASKELTRKLYISRKRESDRLRLLRDALTLYENTGVFEESLDQFDRDKIVHYSGDAELTRVLMEQANTRCLLEGDEEKIEEFFASRGYEIISPGDYTFMEQVNLFSEAKSVVGFGGSGMTNTVFCNENANILVLCPTAGFGDGHHLALAKGRGKNAMPAPQLYRREMESVFTAEEILDHAEKYFGEWL